MTDEIKAVEGDAKTVLADTNRVIEGLEADEVKAGGWVKTHVAWIIGLGCFVLGAATRFIHL